MKNFARTAASITLKLTLFWAVMAAALLTTAGSPDSIKKTLADSNIYDNLVSDVLESATKNNEDQADLQSTILSQAPVKQAAETALPPETLQNSTEQAIDGIYRWLNGEVQLPDFRIDLTAAKAQFITAAGEAAETHVAGLPACTAQDLATGITPDSDPFKLTCRPPQVTPAMARQQVEADLNNNDDFLKDPVITLETFTQEDNGRNPFADSQAPAQFRRAKSLPFILLLISAALGAAVFFLSENYRQGTKRLAKTVLGVGAVLFITVWLVGFIFNRLSAPGGAIGRNLSEDGLEASALSIIRTLSSSFNKTVLIYSLTYIALGGLTLLAVKFLWKQQPSNPVASKIKK